MARKAKHDWPYWWAVWQKVKEKSEINLVQFCADNDLPYDSCRINFKKIERNQTEKTEIIETEKTTTEKIKTERIPKKRRAHNWVDYKEEFLRGDYANLSEFAREKGIDPKNSNFERKTKGWLDEKGEIRGKVQENAVSQIVHAKSADIYADALIKLYKCVAILEKVQGKDEIVLKRVKTPRDAKDSAIWVNESIKAIKEIVPIIREFQERKDRSDILERLKIKEIDAATAALEFEMLGLPIPKAVEMMLARMPAPVLSEPEVYGLDDDELEALHQEGLKNYEQQLIEWVPKRQEIIEKVKQEMKGNDSFAIEKLMGEMDKPSEGEED
jgi:hypothetical protein